MTITPLQSASDVFARAEGLVRESLAIQDPLVADDMLRSALAFSVAALDTYLHWAIADTSLKSGVPAALGGLAVPLSELVSLSEAMVANREKIRPKVRVRNALERAILKHTFQSVKGVSDAMNMLGKRNAFAKISAQIDPPQAVGEIQDQLMVIVHRRNQVVHEGDMQRQSRPQNLRREPVEVAEIRSEIAWLRGLVAAIDKVLND